MRRPREHGAAVAVAAAMAVLIAGCGVIDGDSGPETVVIAADLELTGDGSALGSVYRDALQLRVDQVNQQGLLGDRQLELLVTDNRSDPETAATNLAELFADPSLVAVITGQCAACLVAAADALETHELPAISLSNSDEILETEEHGRHLFKLGPNADHNAGALTAELRRAEVRTVAVVATTDSYGEAGLRQMQEAADASGIEVVLTEQVSTDPEAVGGVAARINAYQRPVDPAQVGLGQQPEQAPTGPDAVVIWTPGPVAGELALSLREQGYEGEFFLDASAADQLFLTGEAGAALEGARMIFTETLVIDDVVATSPARAARQAWFRDYLARQGTYHAYSSFAADAVQLIVNGINRFGSTDRESVRTAIEAAQTEGLTGPLRMTAENHSGLMPQALITLVASGGRWRPAN